MPLSTGQITFAIIFASVFLTVIVWAYIVDRNKQKKYYKNSFLIIMGIAGILAGVYFLVKLL